MSDKLLPCPFCGNGADIFIDNRSIKVACKTINCVLLPPVKDVGFLDKQDAIEAWNRRSK